MTKNIRLTIFACDDILSKDIIYKELREMKSECRIAANKAMNLQFVEMYRRLEEDAIDTKTYYGKSFKAWLENQLNAEISGMNSGNIAYLNNFIVSKSNFDSKKLLRGEESLTTFKNDLPVFIHNNNYKLIKGDNGKYSVLISLFNKDKMKELDCKQINFGLYDIKAYQRSVVDRMINKE